ncbi:hypothetical protein Tsubulata_014571 [Turnera subulata]|uniref:RING-type domain-containing protein n=1 Tax=Turnera subulata TaxID=218843 RepID=A0A9Q0J883_9ROSI|nr:hypothetical protein Tsubulata_014571 [Turnera subulata]
MWGFASKAIRGRIRVRRNDGVLNPTQAPSDCSDDEPCLSNRAREEGLECPICWESFNIVENVPHVLWCGHTLCKNCVLGLQRAVVKLPTLPIQLPFFVSCPWCNLLSFRLVYGGNLRFPCKNYFLLWMVESMNGDRSKAHSSHHRDHQPGGSSGTNSARNRVGQVSSRGAPGSGTGEGSASNVDGGNANVGYFNVGRVQLSIRKSLVFFVHLTAKFPLIVIFLLIVLYAIPASAAILALYVLVTVVFAIPSFLVLYFAIPSLDWLVREIIT